MFTLTSGRSRTCEGSTRRDFLRIGALGLGALSLADVFRLRARAATERLDFVRDKAVVVLNLQGGPTHIETFDPKMSAPVEYRAMFGETPTSLPGVTFGSHFPQLGALAHRMSIVRSFAHGNGSHASAAALVMAGGNPTGAQMGVLSSRIAGTNSKRTGMPSNVVLPPKACGDAYKDLGAQTDRVVQVGSLPSSYKPFDPSAGGQIIQNMKLNVPEARLADRRSLLSTLDGFKREVEAADALGGADEFQQQAFDVILGGISDAFDLSKEDPRTLARYDTSRFAIPPALLKKKANVPGQSPIALGRQMLMARRLVEADCRFITVTSAGWDMHGNAFGINDGMPLLGPAVDRAASAFLEDLEERGLSDKVLLVITGEFGRTPKINGKGGRDHWGNLCTLAFAGGGLPMGQVIGQSDRLAGTPDGDPITPSHLLATVMHALFDIGQLRLAAGVPTEILRAVTESAPIRELV
jgi:uncharacterized protein (DUF1501 family)